MNRTVNLETGRLLIREWRDSDAKYFLEMSRDIGYTAFSIPGQFFVRDETEALEKISARRRVFNETGLCKLPVFLRASDEFVGTCGIDPYTLNEASEVELGYRLLLRYWGHGYASEAARAIVNYAFESLNRQRVIAFAAPQNMPSIKVIERLGFEFRGETTHAGIPHRLYQTTKLKPS